VLEPWLSPTKTLIDAGAGTGRHAAPLADRLDWVTAVEPSVGMRELIPPKSNLTVVGSGWEEAEVAPADLVICCHVLYFLADPVPFIEKLEASARERVFICLRYGQLRTPSDPLWELLTGTPRARQPQFSDLYNLLLAMGIQAEVDVIRYEGIQRYPDEEAFIAEYAQPLGASWDQAKAAAWMRENVGREPDGSLVYGLGETVSGVAHWRPR
jgi:SAM-dependent methyltransferase